MMKDTYTNSVIGYTRVSSQNQSNNTSLPHQKQKIEEYCNLNDLELTEVYSEVDSGGKDDRVSITPNIPVETSEVSEEVVKTAALPSNVNQNTGLTHVEEALLSNEEKAMRLRQRGMTA